jgi:hypothetical protein
VKETLKSRFRGTGKSRGRTRNRHNTDLMAIHASLSIAKDSYGEHHATLKKRYFFFFSHTCTFSIEKASNVGEMNVKINQEF